jgi:hypothetical protein
LPDERDRRSRLERFGCGLGCFGFVVGAVGLLALMIAVFWAFASGH